METLATFRNDCGYSNDYISAYYTLCDAHIELCTQYSWPEHHPPVKSALRTMRNARVYLHQMSQKYRLLEELQR
jgi:hypothetical protein